MIVVSDCDDVHRIDPRLSLFLLMLDAATESIAKIRQVDIIVRDANRIHHFSKNSQCSCQDHF